MLFVGRRDRDSILRPDSQRQLLTASWNARDGLEPRLEVSNGPGWGDAAL
jgi:hypothetical protein